MKLLVSVRDAVEAETAVQCDVQIVDLKEPSHGSLGRPDDEVIRRVMMAVGGRCPVSVAMGDLTPDHHPAPLPGDCRPDFAKVGCVGFRDLADWSSRFQDWANQLPVSTCPIAVLYIDNAQIGLSRQLDFVRLAAGVSARGVLVDTQKKDGRSTFDHASVADIVRLRRAAHSRGMLFAFAGSIGPKTLPQAALVQPDIVGIRGAACANGRASMVDATKLNQLRIAFSFSSPASTAT